MAVVWGLGEGEAFATDVGFRFGAFAGVGAFGAIGVEDAAVFVADIIGFAIGVDFAAFAKAADRAV